MSASFDLSEPDKITVGAVGPAGGRTFFLQAREGERLVTLKVEKQQVAALAELLTTLLEGLESQTETTAAAAVELEEPALAEWAAGSMQLSYEEEIDRIVLLIEEDITRLAPSSDEGGAMARIVFTRAQAVVLAEKGSDLVNAGRPPCPLCGYPLDPAGHSCPKTNGHRAPTL